MAWFSITKIEKKLLQFFVSKYFDFGCLKISNYEKTNNRIWLIICRYVPEEYLEITSKQKFEKLCKKTQIFSKNNNSSCSIFARQPIDQQLWFLLKSDPKPHPTTNQPENCHKTPYEPVGDEFTPQANRVSPISTQDP